MEEKIWWFRKIEKKQKDKDIFPYVLYIIFVFIIFCSFSIFLNIKNMALADNMDVENSMIDFDLAVFEKQWLSPSIARLYNDYKNGENIFQKDMIQIDYILSNTDKIQQMLSLFWFGEEMNTILDVINKYVYYKNDIFELLGAKEKKTYLIMLENISERRADGGFIWSFIKISLEWGHLLDMKVYDAYYPLWEYCKNQDSADITDINDTDKWWTSCKNKFMLSSKVEEEPYKKHWYSTTFINSNIYWFTDLNGKSVIDLYNKIYDEKIDGVVFVKSNILEKLLNNGREIYWEMEFMNYLSGKSDNVDKNAKSNEIKWLNWKKKDYLLSLNNILKNRKKEVILNLIRNYDDILKDWLIRLYLPELGEDLTQVLEKDNLIFKRDKSKFYLFDYNVGSDKSSKFLTTVVDINWTVYDKPYPLDLEKGLNIINFEYEVYISDEYKEFIENMESKYNIKLPEYSYLLEEEYIYKLIPILPNNCELLEMKGNTMQINCN